MAARLSGGWRRRVPAAARRRFWQHQNRPKWCRFIPAPTACALIPLQGLGEVIGLGATAHAALAVGFLTVAFLHRWTADRRSAAGSLLLGIACGAAFHVLPPLLLVVLGNLIFEFWWKRGRRKWLLSKLVAAGAIPACVPWTWRNYTALHGFFLIRSNFGLELRIANHPGADADIEVTYARSGTLRHSSENLEEGPSGARPGRNGVQAADQERGA